LRRQKPQEVLVAPVDDYSFRLAEKGMYFRPNFRKTAPAKFIAFYRLRPISAVTHIATVIETVEHGMQRIYSLNDLKALPNPIPKGRRTVVQNYKFTTLARLSLAKTLSDL
jgi:hypothetical protein